MMGHALKQYAFLCLFILGIAFSAPAVTQQQPSANPTTQPGAGQLSTIPPDQVKSLIKDLEDPAARERLIQQLKLLTQIRAAEKEPQSEVKDATAQLLEAVSNKINSLSADVFQLTHSMSDVSFTLIWLKGQFMDPYARLVWMETIINLALVLGLGYVAFYVLRFSLLRPRRSLAQRTSQSITAKAFLLFVVLLLDLFPIIGFAASAYVTLGVVDPDEKTRLVALAWINAAIITRLILTAGRAVFAPTTPSLRLIPVTDETAQYADIWIRRLSFTPVYGYFALQAALLLDLPGIAYAALLRLLGFIVTLLVLVFIMQNRAAVANYIRGDQGEEGETKPRFRALRNRLAQIWFLLAALYVLILYGIWALSITGGFLFLLRATIITLLILVVAHYVLRVVNHIFERGFHISRELKSKFPGLEARANRYIPAIHALFRWAVYGAVIVGILQAWDVNALTWLASRPGRVLGNTAFTIISILLISFAIWELASSLIENYLAEKDRYGRVRVRSARARTLLTVSRNALFALLLIVSTLMILSQLGVNITPLLAGAGVLGVAVGFGSQKLVQDIITGIFILFEDLISVGDVVNVGDKGGLVEAVSIRNVRLRDLSGTVHTIPYSAISTVSNLTKDFSYYVFDVGIAYREDADHVMEVLKQIGAEMQKDRGFARLILEPLEILGVDAFADSAVIIKARIKTLPIQQWNVGREFNRRMKKRFDELGIEIPFPHRTLYFGVDTKGEAPPARVQLSPGISAETSPPSLEKITGDRMAARYAEQYDKS